MFINLYATIMQWSSGGRVARGVGVVVKTTTIKHNDCESSNLTDLFYSMGSNVATIGLPASMEE